ncbi:MAG: hypothetical protein VX473_02565 [Candidatus Thermoplasmatota archaeon]|nr:hypothetical protein [Candidatus Thermoplasmatota archaeon]
MPWSAYALFAILAALFGFGASRIMYAEENPAHTTRLGNVRASPIQVNEPRPNRFALEDDMASLPTKTMDEPDTEQPVVDDEPEIEDEVPLEAEMIEEEQPLNANEFLDSSEALLAEIGAEWDTNPRMKPDSEKLVEETGEEVSNPDLSEFHDRLAREGAQTGQVQVSLIWDNKNDLDLSVICPSGERISFDNKLSSCGGQLDVDMNESPTSEQPVENIFWPAGRAPKGEYKVLIEHFEHHAEEDLTPYRVLVDDGTGPKEYRGEITNDEPPRLVCVFTVE